MAGDTAGPWSAGWSVWSVGWSAGWSTWSAGTVDAASAELKKYQDLRDKDAVDDSDELLKRAKIKKADIEARNAPATPVEVPTAMPSAAPT